jgi:hypothetical protein
VLSPETLAAIERAEPDYSTEVPADDPPADEQPDKKKKNKGGRPPGANYERNKRPSRPRKTPLPAAPPAPVAPVPPAEPPKALVKGCRWIMRNVVTVMVDGYGWDAPEDYEAWLQEVSQFGASTIQKYFPDWMERWGDELLLIAMILIWVTPNVIKQSKKSRERQQQDSGNAGAQGLGENDPTLQATVAA